MTVHYSRFMLNTYSATPYFQSQVSPDYPLSLVLMKGRAFRRLPPYLQELSAKAKQWSMKNSTYPRGIPNIEQWYDDQGNELDPQTRQPLTDEEIDAEWDSIGLGPEIENFSVQDVQPPPGGFADPATWKPATTVDEPEEEERPAEEQLRRDIASHGREAVSKTYGIPVEQLPQ